MSQDLGITERAINTSEQINSKWNEIEEQYHISENAASATTAVADTVSNIGGTIANGVATTLQTPVAQKTMSTLSNWACAIGDFFKPAATAISEEYNFIKEKSMEEIQTKQYQKQAPVELQEMSHEELNDISVDIDNISEEGKDGKPIELVMGNKQLVLFIIN